MPPTAYHLPFADAPRSADLVIVGGGIVGAATAFFATRAGLDTVLLEKRPALATLTTPVSTGAFRLQFDNPEEIELVREGVALFERFGTWLGVGMASLMNAFEPELLAVGGGLSRVAELYLERAEQEARSRVLPAIGERVRVAVAHGGTDAGLIGAARLAVTELAAREP